MAERVASLYAEIGANTSGLKAGLDSAKTAMVSAKADLGDLATTAKSSTRAIDVHFDNMADSIGANLNSAKSDFDRFSSSLKAGAAKAASGLSGFSSGAINALKGAGEAWNEHATTVNQSLEVLGKVGRAAQQAYAYISEGTQLATTERQFGALSNSIGSTADALLGELKTATRGTISDFELMKSATSIMSLGLADTSEETVRLASLVGKLGWDMNQVTLTLANQSTMRLDSLGLSVSDVTSRVDALKAAGYSADQAFKFAILEAGEEKVKLLGDVADTTAGKLAILEANAANAGDTFKKTFGEEFIANLNSVAGGLFEAEESASSFGETLAKIVTNVSLLGFIRFTKEQIADLGNESKNAQGKISGMGGVIAELPPDLQAATRDTTRLADVSKVYRDDVIAASAATDGWMASLNTVTTMTPQAIQQISQLASTIYQETSPAYAEFQDKLIQSNSQLSENEAMVAQANARIVEWGETIPTVTGAIYASAEAIAAHNAATGDYAMMAINAGEDGINLNNVVMDSIDAFGGGAEAIVAYGLATGQMTEKQAEAILKQAAMIEYARGLGEAIANGTMSINDAVTSLSDFQAGLENSNILVNGATGSVLLMNDAMIGSTSAVGSLQTSLDEFNTDNAVGATQAFLDKLNSIPRTIDVQVNVHGGDTSGVNYGGGGYQAPGDGGNIPHNAEGTGFFPGGRTWVGERGPEIVTLPRGSQIASAEQSRQMTGNTYNLYVTAMDGGANVTREFNYMQALAGG